MPIAFFPVGVGGYGLAPVIWTPGIAFAGAPLALRFDPTIRGYVMNADGTMAGVHPVDQKVALTLFVDEGSVSSAPKLGNRLRTVLNRVDPAKGDAIAQAELQRCLGPFIAAGEILLTGFVRQFSGSGRTAIAIAYVNLKDPRYNPQNPALAGRTLSGVPLSQA